MGVRLIQVSLYLDNVLVTQCSHLKSLPLLHIMLVAMYTDHTYKQPGSVMDTFLKGVCV